MVKRDTITKDTSIKDLKMFITKKSLENTVNFMMIPALKSIMEITYVKFTFIELIEF